MKLINKSLYAFAILLLPSSPLIAQTLFREGKLIYKADTIKRLQPYPASFIPSKMVIYQKGELLRVEFWFTDSNDSTNVRKEIQLRNTKGTYLFAEFSKPITSKGPRFALFTSYEAEKHYRAEATQNGIDNFYQVDHVIQKVTWLNLPAEKVLLRNGQKSEPMEAILTTAIDIPIRLIINTLDKLPGTPLQVVFDMRGWQMQYTAIRFDSEPMPPTLFEIDPDFTIMTIDPSGK